MSDVRERMVRNALGPHEDNTFQLGWIACLDAQRRKAGKPDTFTATDWAELQEALQHHRHTRQQIEES